MSGNAGKTHGAKKMEHNIDQIIDNAVNAALQKHRNTPATQTPTRYFAQEAKGLSSAAESSLTQIFQMRKLSKDSPAWIDVLAKLHTETEDDRFKGKSLNEIIAIAVYAATGKVKTDSFYKMGGK